MSLRRSSEMEPIHMCNTERRDVSFKRASHSLKHATSDISNSVLRDSIQSFELSCINDIVMQSKCFGPRSSRSFKRRSSEINCAAGHYSTSIPLRSDCKTSICSLEISIESAEGSDILSLSNFSFSDYAWSTKESWLFGKHRFEAKSDNKK